MASHARLSKAQLHCGSESQFLCGETHRLEIVFDILKSIGGHVEELEKCFRQRSRRVQKIGSCGGVARRCSSPRARSVEI